MKELKHTAGPWNFIDKELEEGDILICNGARQWIATLTPRMGIIDNKANARLIASAPEMLEELIGVAKVFKHQGHGILFKQTVSIIEKATGEKIEDLI
jgi:hypothetical protein